MGYLLLKRDQELKNDVTKEYINFGDVNPLDYDGKWIKGLGDGVYHIVSADNLDWAAGKKGYYLQSAYIDINDSWIDIEAVKSCAGNETGDGLSLARDIFEYYGAYNCGGEYSTVLTRRDARKYINSFGIIIHRK